MNNKAIRKFTSFKTLAIAIPLLAGMTFSSANAARSAPVVNYSPEAFIQQPSLSPDAAMAMVHACKEYAESKGWHFSIAVVDAGGKLMAFHRMDKTSLNSINSAQKKALSSVLVRSSTKKLANMVENYSTPALHAAHQLAMGFYAAQGGLPVIVNGRAVAAIAASGQSPASDEECAQHAIDTVLVK